MNVGDRVKCVAPPDRVELPFEGITDLYPSRYYLGKTGSIQRIEKDLYSVVFDDGPEIWCSDKMLKKCK